MTYDYRDVNVRKHDRRHPQNPSQSVHVRRHSRHQRVSSGKPEEMNYLMAGKPPQEESDYPDIPRGRIIWSQISLATKMAVGARDPVVDDKKGYLHFRVTKTPGDFRKIQVQLTPMDTYDVRLITINRRTYEVVTEKEARDIYAEDLSEIIYDMVHDTGPYSGTMRSPSGNRKAREFATFHEAKDHISRAPVKDHQEIMRGLHEGSIDEALWAAHRQGNITIKEPRERTQKDLHERQASLRYRIRQHQEHINGGRTYEGRKMTDEELQSWRTNLSNMENEYLQNKLEMGRIKGGMR